MSLNDKIENLTPEQIKKLKTVTNKADLSTALCEFGIELTDEEADVVAGGAPPYIFPPGTGGITF